MLRESLQSLTLEKYVCLFNSVSQTFFFQQNKINKTPKENVISPAERTLENTSYLNLVYTHLDF